MTEKQERDQGPFTVVAKVISQEGRCAAGHQVGDEVIFDGRTVQGRMCIQARHSSLPRVFATRNGAVFHWAKDPDAVSSACPDAKNPVVFEIRRLRE